MTAAAEPTKRTRAGRLELAVKRDVRAIGKLPDGGHALAEIALILARAIDDPAAPLTVKAKLAQELRVTMGQLREVARDSSDGVGDPAGESGSPVWDGPVAGAPDAGAAGR